MSQKSDLTSLLQDIDAGRPEAYQELVPLIYQQLRAIAKNRMNAERTDHTLSATGLVNEAFLRLVQVPEDHRWNNSVHFFSAAAEAMRRVLIDHARKKNSLKRGGEHQRVSAEVNELLNDQAEIDFDSDDLLMLDQAISALEKEDSETAEIVKLRFFAGLKRDQVAEQLKLSPRTVSSRWTYARAWLKRYIGENR